MNYYNEFDPHAAAWLRQLIADGLIPDGVVDERSIEDVKPVELSMYTQCHFFAGIGGWSHALDLAGWPQDRPVWTGSCPCQPFSSAGKGAGFADERHLWPAWQHLIAQCRPPIIFGEQVASKAVGSWIDLIHADLEGLGYAFGSVPFPSASVGAPHIRDRNYWMAYADRSGSQSGQRDNQATRHGAPIAADSEPCGLGYAVGARLEGQRRHGDGGDEPRRLDSQQVGPATKAGAACGLADDTSARLEGAAGQILQGRGARYAGSSNAGGLGHAYGEQQCAKRGVLERLPTESAGGRAAGGLADANGSACPQGREDAGGRNTGSDAQPRPGPGGDERDSRPGPPHGFWRDADWLGCRDGKWRPVIPSYVSLFDGVSHRVVSSGDKGLEQKAEIDGKANETDAVQGVSSVRSSDAPGQVQKESGGSFGIQTQGLLRPSVHGGGHGEGCLLQPEPQQAQGCSVSGKGVQKLRKGREAARPPHRREPFQQLQVELDDIVSALPSSIALAKLHGRWRDADALHALCKAIGEVKALPYSPEQTPAVWASLSEEEKDRVRLGVDVRAWRRVVFHPLSVGEPARAMRLKGYGNAINPHQAAAFIRTVCND